MHWILFSALPQMMHPNLLLVKRNTVVCPMKQAGIVDDLLVYCIEENKVYMLVVNASNIEKDWNWISKFNTKNVEMHNISDKTCLLAIQGPNATKILQPLTDLDILNLKYYTFAKGKFAGVDNVLISATGYTGAGGVEIYFEDKDGNADKIWDAIFSAASTQRLNQLGLGQEIHFAWKWVIVYTEMILTIPLRHWKRGWAG